MSRLWPPQAVHHPPVVTALRTVFVARVPRVVAVGRTVTVLIAPARLLARLAKKPLLSLRELVRQVKSCAPLLSPLLLDMPPPTRGAMQ